MQKISNLTTPQIMVYAELTTKQLEELDAYGMDVTVCESHGGITESEKDEIHISLSEKMNVIEESRILLVKEINKRMRRDLNTSFGPSDVQPYLNKFQKNYPYIGLGESEIKARLKEQTKKV